MSFFSALAPINDITLLGMILIFVASVGLGWVFWRAAKAVWSRWDSKRPQKSGIWWWW